MVVIQCSFGQGAVDVLADGHNEMLFHCGARQTEPAIGGRLALLLRVIRGGNAPCLPLETLHWRLPGGTAWRTAPAPVVWPLGPAPSLPPGAAHRLLPEEEGPVFLDLAVARARHQPPYTAQARAVGGGAACMFWCRGLAT